MAEEVKYLYVTDQKTYSVARHRAFVVLDVRKIILNEYLLEGPLWSSGQSSWLHI
jgi:hypothetical protein